ncbi:16S rRNA (guanine(527)-N(7))-methyltransferase RsmG [Variovorax sp. J22P240]|uniref:16S rRNA (guanine(527)-N(7))-methyltransferase RsmG n=1 Tax=Variovorax sp. J22P240 TaxID=3053514 RepID=UPI002575C2C6|nr:16S rRNA (guanine(527)-N(7))-methyltransferase RsmG [Variovorax sp. J22P240]MDL9999247.1 16S rRNA (guanine(527)-N(7))-methyltransferase RsmG [Variovorax sp. J22P240]
MSQEQLLRDGAQQLGIELTDRQGERLLAYGALILKWNKVYNLTALRDPAAVLTHHLLDSLSVIKPLQRERSTEAKLLDVGAGAGLPGVVIAILRDDIDVTCLDAVAKKTAFVQQVASELGLRNLRGLHARVESLTGSYDVISSRAFASLPDFITGSAHLLASGGIWLAMKGRAPDDEIAQLPAQAAVFHVEQLSVPGLDAERCIVWMRKPTA